MLVGHSINPPSGDCERSKFSKGNLGLEKLARYLLLCKYVWMRYVSPRVWMWTCKRRSINVWDFIDRDYPDY